MAARLLKVVVVFGVGMYVGIALVTAAIAGPACKLACQASTPADPVGCAVMGVLWPATLPGFIQ